MAGSGFSERLRLLQERDKDLRESRHRQTNIETAKAVRGTCLDMCPEMERFFREETNQLSPLEMTQDGKPDPHAMVKEYRRAGADQSEPLPHEMRPPAVLQRTMDYLVCNIVDKIVSDASIAGDWYDFLWSRTRAIRKDITQQHLCDRDSVDLLEKCARFHVLCAGTMIEEDLMIFDPKINDENLRKCIQSLKDFYHDLHLRGGQVCPNESEFRAYDILLNLSDSDILREVAHLRKDIRDSPPVLFAITCHFALTSNNFIKFFQLVSSASFLQSSLLHRYFNEVRLSAVKIMRKSFTVPNQTEMYSAEDFCRQLGFDDLTQVGAFCSNVGLAFDGAFVHLTRGYPSETPSLLKTRSYVLVDSKRTTSMGEVVHGGPLPENPYQKYPIHSSFQEDGSLKPNALMPPQSPQVSQTTSQFPSQPFFGQSKTATPAFNLFSGFGSLTKKEESLEPEPVSDEQIEELSDVTGETVSTLLVKDLVKQFVVESIQELKDEAKRHEDIIEATTDRIINVGTRSLLHEVVKLVVEEETEIKRSLELRAMIKEYAETISEDIIQTLITQILNEFLAENFRSRIEKSTYLISGDYLKTVCMILLREVAKEVVEAAVQEREQLINHMLEKRNFRLSRKYFSIWLNVYRKEKRLRRLKESFPASNIVSGEVTVICTPSSDKTKRRSAPMAGTKRKSPMDLKTSSTPPETASKRAMRTNSGKKTDKKTNGVSPTVSVTQTAQTRRSPRGLTTDSINAAKEAISLRNSKDPESRMKYLQQKIQEAKEREESSKAINDCIARSLVHLESYDF